MKHRVLRNLRYVAALTGLSMLFGIALAIVQGGLKADSFVNGAVDAFVVAGCLSTYHMFVFRGLLREQTRRFTFAGLLLLNSLVYLVIIVGGRVLGALISDALGSPRRILDDPHWGQTLILAAGLAVLINFAMQLGDLIGRGELIRFLSGRYHRPRGERRVFLFLDLASSTTIAEKIGDELFLDLLHRFYSDMTEVILQTGGSIYKYVGDEVIISWAPARARRNYDCLRFPGLFQKELDRREETYRERYGVVPRFRAAVHAGTVMTGEMGDLKKEIVYLGDVLNTTARVVELCRALERPVLATGDVMDTIGVVSSRDLRLEDLGEQSLRGKQGAVRVFAVGE